LLHEPTVQAVSVSHGSEESFTSEEISPYTPRAVRAPRQFHYAIKGSTPLACTFRPLTPDGAASQQLGHCPSRDSDISNASTQLRG
jgi:hypothetical protein